MQRVEAEPIDKLGRPIDVPYGEIGPFAGFEGSCLAREAKRAGRVAGGAGEAFVHREPEQSRRHVKREEERGHWRRARIGIGGDSHWQATLSHEFYRRRLSFVKHII